VDRLGDCVGQRVDVIGVDAGDDEDRHEIAVAQLAAQIQPKGAIPCHYDMFRDNSVDPGQFRASLTLRAPEVRYVRLEHGKPFVFEG